MFYSYYDICDLLGRCVIAKSPVSYIGRNDVITVWSFRLIFCQMLSSDFLKGRVVRKDYVTLAVHTIYCIIGFCSSILGQKLHDSNVHGANMGPTWGRQDPDGPNVGPINLAIWTVSLYRSVKTGPSRSVDYTGWNVLNSCILLFCLLTALLNYHLMLRVLLITNIPKKLALIGW